MWHLQICINLTCSTIVAITNLSKLSCATIVAITKLLELKLLYNSGNYKITRIEIALQ